jgi:predicted MFS family arabinose efflux permease
VLNAFTLSVLLAGVLQLAMWLPAQGNISLTYVFSFLYGTFGLAAIGISPAVLARHLDPNKLPSIGGVFFTSEMPGFLAGAPISGAILARSNYETTIGYSGGVMVAGALLSVMARFMGKCQLLGWPERKLIPRLMPSYDTVSRRLFVKV